MTAQNRFPMADELTHLLQSERPVFSVGADSPDPRARTAWEHVFRWSDGYLLFGTDQDHPIVFPTLREAIEKAELNHVTRATREIHSSEMAAAQIAALLRADDEQVHYQILINGESWHSDGTGEFRRVE